MGDRWLERLDHRARLREQGGLTRRLSPRSASSGLIDLAGNDYLGLANHPDVVAAASKALAEYGLGATGSRLVRGSTDEHAGLEAALGSLLQQPAALVYSSGYLANLGAITGAVQPRGAIVIDAHAHASLHDGCRLSAAETKVVAHADVDALRALLDDLAGRPVLVVTESVFSVDGDLAPLRDIHAVCREAGAVLLVDDAHAVGLLGPAGGGAVADARLAGEPDVVVTATLSKSIGAAGGVVGGHAAFISHLVNTGRTFVYDTALPPAVAAGALAAIEVLRSRDDLRSLVKSRAARSVDVLRGAGFAVSNPAAGIVSVTAPDAASALAWSLACRERGVAVGCFRPPSTPDNKSRLRLTINAGIPASDFENALSVIVETAP